MSLYYVNADSQKVNWGYYNNSDISAVYKGEDLVWRLGKDAAILLQSNNSYISHYLNNRPHFYNMKLVGLDDTIKTYNRVDNRSQHGRHVYAKDIRGADGNYESCIYSTSGNFYFGVDSSPENRPSFVGITGNAKYNTYNIPYTYYTKDNNTGAISEITTTLSYSDFNSMFRYCENMHGSFEGQPYITGRAVCGHLTTDFSNCFKGCRNITEAVCGPAVENFSFTYYNCQSIRGVAYGVSVNEMQYTYYNCRGLSGEAACGPRVMNFQYCYDNCRNLKKAECSDSVINMHHTYSWCTSLTGTAACGGAVEDMSYAYFYCPNLSGAACGSSVENMSYAYYNCRNITGDAVVSSTVKYMSHTFYGCRNITGFIEPSGVIYMNSAYEDCYNLQGRVSIPASVEQADNVFSGDNNITSATIKSSSIKSFGYAFSGCSNLQSCTVLGSIDSITDMHSSFSGCRNLRMQAFVSSQVQSLNSAYDNCQNVYGSVVIPESITDLQYAFHNTKITSFTLPMISTHVSIFGAFESIGNVLKERGTATIYCPKASSLYQDLIDSYNFYDDSDGHRQEYFTGYNKSYDLRLV